MFRLLVRVLIVMLACLGLKPDSANAVLSPADKATAKMFLEQKRDIRTTRDMAIVDFETIANSNPWILAVITPTHGYMYTKGQYIIGATGQVITPPGAPTLLVDMGSIKVLDTLNGAPQALSEFKWERRWNPRASGRSSADQYQPLRVGAGGTVILRVQEQGVESSPFSPIYVIPDDWAKFAAPALKYYQMHEELFDSGSAIQNRAQLLKLLMDENPFIAVSAARILGEAYLLDRDFIRGPLSQASAVRQAVFTCLALKHLPSKQEDTLVEEILKVVDAAKSSEMLKNMAVGGVAALDPTTTLLSPQHVQALWQHVNKRQMALNTHTDADEYINALLIGVGVRTEVKKISQEQPK